MRNEETMHTPTEPEAVEPELVEEPDVEAEPVDERGPAETQAEPDE
jgi:hypothetical protein